MIPDQKPSARVRDAALLKALHREWRECVLCGSTSSLSLHHIHRHPRDDTRGNLVMVCGSGTTGCHGRIEANDPVVLKLLGEYIVRCRPDTVEYLHLKLGEGADGWMERRLKVEP